jgi:hypothetical protein
MLPLSEGRAGEAWEHFDKFMLRLLSNYSSHFSRDLLFHRVSCYSFLPLSLPCFTVSPAILSYHFLFHASAGWRGNRDLFIKCMSALSLIECDDKTLSETFRKSKEILSDRSADITFTQLRTWSVFPVVTVYCVYSTGHVLAVCSLRKQKQKGRCQLGSWEYNRNNLWFWWKRCFKTVLQVLSRCSSCIDIPVRHVACAGKSH